MTAPTVPDLRALLDRVAQPARGDDTRLDRALAGDGAGEQLDHDRVRAADPLGLDAVLRRLPEVNRAGDVDTLAGWLAGVAERGDPGFPVEEATAALRDAGMLLASLRRAGVDPLSVVPSVEPALLGWAARTGMVPRDTVVHYGLWNPVGERERRFTDDGPQEGALIQSVRVSCRLLPLAGAALDVAWRHGETTPSGLAALAVMRAAVRCFGAEFTRVRGIVHPHFFMDELRPYFEPVVIAGTAYHGPAAAFIPMYLVDGLLWGGGETLSTLHHEALTYGRPEWRHARERIADRQPVATRLAERVAQATPELTAALELADDAMHALMRFRGQHVTTARQAYGSPGARYRHGSGGFDPAALKRAADEERQAATAVHAAEQHAQGVR